MVIRLFFDKKLFENFFNFFTKPLDKILILWYNYYRKREREVFKMENYYVRGIEEFIPENYDELEAVLAKMAEQEREVKGND